MSKKSPPSTRRRALARASLSGLEFPGGECFRSRSKILKLLKWQLLETGNKVYVGALKTDERAICVVGSIYNPQELNASEIS